MIWTPRVTVAAIVYYQNRFLLVEEEEQGQRVLNQPAGHLEKGESLLDAAIRETAEETGGVFIPSSLTGIYRWQHPTKDLTFLRFCYAGDLQDPQQLLQPRDADILQTVWMSYDDIELNKQRLRSPLVLQCIDDYLAGQRFPLDVCREKQP